MAKTIKLNKDVSIDIPTLMQTGMVILANAGSGKSYAIRKIAEEAVGQIQVIILDPEGEFASLRDKYDFILGGKDADVPVEPRSAALLAIKLLELEKSAVLDLYELPPYDRQRFVKLFCEALVNCPKNLYHPVIIILDEAHMYVPEGKPSEATTAVENLASLGRKRGQRLILASQRIAKISKNVTAECNNKLIGRASQDIDMKRAADELGFNKEKMVELRQLRPGEFFAFGPAISDDVSKIKIGEVKTAHAKVVYKGGGRIPPPSDVIKKVLGELKDLPEEAKKEATTAKELKEEVTRLKRLLVIKNGTFVEKQVIDQKAIDRAVKIATHEENKKFDVERAGMIRQTKNFLHIIQQIGKIVSPLLKDKIEITAPVFKARTRDEMATDVLKNGFKPVYTKTPEQNIEISDKPIQGGALRMLKVLASRHPMEFTRSQLATFSKMSPNSGTFGTYLALLRTQGMIETNGGLLKVSDRGLEHANVDPITPQTTEEVIEMWKSNLSGGARRMFEVLVEAYPEAVSRDVLGERSNISPTSGTFGTYLAMIRSNGLAENAGSEIKLSENLILKQ